jgi:4-hydroxybenzoate decarboxylase subunit C
MHTNLRSFLNDLKKEKEIIEVSAEVDPYLEIPEIHRRVIDEGGPALYFSNVKGSKIPVVTNMFGTARRIELAFGSKPTQLMRDLVSSIDELMPPKLNTLYKKRSMFKDLIKLGNKQVSYKSAPVTDVYTNDVNLKELPALTGYHLDSNPFVTLPLVYTEHPDPNINEHNLGMYRIEIKEKAKTGMHWQIHKGGGFHHYEAEKRNQALPTTLFIGGPPALMIAAISPLPEAVPELLFSSFLMGKKLNVVKSDQHPHPIIAEAEFAIGGVVPPHVREMEGPFGDHYGYYSWEHEFPVFNVQHMWRRKDAIFPATIVGKPKQEDAYIADYLQELFSPLYPVVMNGVKSLWSYWESGQHALASAIVRESYYKEAFAHALRIMGEGQLTLTKFLIVTDQPVKLENFKQLFEAVLERFKPERDILIMSDTSMDTLDYTGRKFNTGSKAIMTGVGEKIRDLTYEYRTGDIAKARAIKPYCGGCLCISGPSYAEDEAYGQFLVDHAQHQLKDWQIVFLVDDANVASSQTSFLWSTFTRFDPAFDLYAQADIVRNKISYKGPIVIDARMKPFYPDIVEPRDDIAKKVSERWREYF